MGCLNCKKVEKSHKEYPFKGANINESLHECSYCGQKWYRHEKCFELWTEINDEYTWEIVKNKAENSSKSSSSTTLTKNKNEQIRGNIYGPCAENLILPDICLIDFKTENFLCLQWYGDLKPYNCARYQFRFTLILKHHRFLKLLSCVDMFTIFFVGKLKDWPNPNRTKECPKEEENYVLQLIKKDSNRNCPIPSSILIDIAPIFEPNLGLINPENYFFHKKRDYI